MMQSATAKPYRVAARSIREDAREALAKLRAERVAKQKSQGVGSPRSEPVARSSARFGASPETQSLLADDAAAQPTPTKIAKPARRKPAKDQTDPEASVNARPVRQARTARRSKTTTSETQARQLDDRLNRARKELSELAAQRREDTRLLKGVERSVTTERNALAKVSKEKARVSADRDAARADLEGLVKRLKQGRAELEEMTAERTALEKNLSALRSSLEEATAALSDKEEAIEHLRIELQEAQDDLLSVREELSDSRSELSVVEQEIAGARQELQAFEASKVAAEADADGIAVSPADDAVARAIAALKRDRLVATKSGAPVVEEAVPSPLSALPGVGEGMIWHLNQVGVHSLDDLAAVDLRLLRRKLGPVGQLARLEDWVAFARGTEG
jgi:predicted  nucleic acid-binding Zn-ribbon protein